MMNYDSMSKAKLIEQLHARDDQVKLFKDAVLEKDGVHNDDVAQIKALNEQLALADQMKNDALKQQADMIAQEVQKIIAQNGTLRTEYEFARQGIVSYDDVIDNLTKLTDVQSSCIKHMVKNLRAQYVTAEKDGEHK